MSEQLTVGQVVEGLNQLPGDELTRLVDYRLRFYVKGLLPGIGGEQDSGDIFVYCQNDFGEDARYRDLFGRLRGTLGSLAEKWTSRDQQHIKRDAEAVAELFYLASRLGAREAIPAVARVAGNSEYGGMLLSRGSNLQSRALISLAGLLMDEAPEVRDQHRQLFEEALDSGYHFDVPISLTTLCTLWPEDRTSFIERARAHDPGNIESVIVNLDVITAARKR